MSSIEIKNLGPVSYFNQSVDDKVMIIIGEQASGKSTIAKCIFFCKSISEEFKKFLADSDELLKPGQHSLFGNFKKKLRTLFIEYFGTTKHMEPFEIIYKFDNQETVTIWLKEGYAQLDFSRKLDLSCKKVINSMKNYYEQQKTDDFDDILQINLLWMAQKDKISKTIDGEVNKLFEQIYAPIFVPAGRSLLSTNSEFFHLLTPNKYDVLMNDFIERIRVLQKQYSQKLEDIVRDKNKLSSEVINISFVKKAMEISKRILKGDYVNEVDGEKIYYDNNKFVKLVQASSGQQEALWIVLLLFSIILNNQKVFLVIEEPEAHLFPKAQKEMVELINLLINATESKVLITTHSPYILTSVNLLMYSEKIEKDSDKKTDVVNKDYRVSNKDTAAYLIKKDKEFSIQNIMDHEDGMIDASEIDTVSQELNEKFDQLIGLELKDEL